MCIANKFLLFYRLHEFSNDLNKKKKKQLLHVALSINVEKVHQCAEP